MVWSYGTAGVAGLPAAHSRSRGRGRARDGWMFAVFWGGESQACEEGREKHGRVAVGWPLDHRHARLGAVSLDPPPPRSPF